MFVTLQDSFWTAVLVASNNTQEAESQKGWEWEPVHIRPGPHDQNWLDALKTWGPL